MFSSISALGMFLLLRFQLLLVHVHVLSVCSGCFSALCVCLQTLGDVGRCSLFSCIRCCRTLLSSSYVLRLNVRRPLVARLAGQRGRGRHRVRWRRRAGERSVPAVPASFLHVTSFCSADVIVAMLRVARVQTVAAEAGEVRGRRASFAWPLQPAVVLTRCGLQGGLGHQKAQRLMGDGVKQEVAFTHQSSLIRQRGKVQRRFPPRHVVGQQALHAERVPFLQGRRPRTSGAGAVRAAWRNLLWFPHGSLVWVVLERTEVVPCLVAAGFSWVSSDAPAERRRLLLAVGELRHPAVALRAAGRVEALAREKFALRLQQLPLLLSLLLLRPLALPPCDLLGVHGLAAARGRVGVVSGPPRPFLRVFLLPPFGSSVLEPHLHTHRAHTRSNAETSEHENSESNSVF